LTPKPHSFLPLPNPWSEKKWSSDRGCLLSIYPSSHSPLRFHLKYSHFNHDHHDHDHHLHQPILPSSPLLRHSPSPSPSIERLPITCRCRDILLRDQLPSVDDSTATPFRRKTGPHSHPTRKLAIFFSVLSDPIFGGTRTGAFFPPQELIFGFHFGHAECTSNISNPPINPPATLSPIARIQDRYISGPIARVEGHLRNGRLWRGIFGNRPSHPYVVCGQGPQ
jgi:hypothetical protein